MQQEKTDIKSMNLEELKSYMESIGEKQFRAKQLYQWMHEKQAASFDEMTNLSKSLQEKLKNECRFVSLKQEAVQISKIDGTRKYLFALDDGNVIESVLMRYKHGNSVCISSQVGCRMGCRFCASTLDGLVRGLTPSEMLDQIYRITRDTGERVANVVVMGTGEPMDNFDNLLKFIELLTDENGNKAKKTEIPVLSGSSLAGAIRHRMETILGDLKAAGVKLPKNNTDIINTIFGYVDEDQACASNIMVHEVDIKDAKPLTMVRTGVSRFESAVKNGSLYTEKTYVDGTLNVRIDVRKGNDPQDEAWILGMLLLVLKDLQNGLLAVGGQTAIGRGIFSANGPITIDGECSVENFLIGNLLKHMTEKGGGEA